jgi:hypothetical protein
MSEEFLRIRLTVYPKVVFFPPSRRIRLRDPKNKRVRAKVRPIGSI